MKAIVATDPAAEAAGIKLAERPEPTPAINGHEFAGVVTALGYGTTQGLFQHGRLRAGQSVLAQGAGGAVGSIVTPLAREAGAYVIGAGVGGRAGRDPAQGPVGSGLGGPGPSSVQKPQQTSIPTVGAVSGL